MSTLNNRKLKENFNQERRIWNIIYFFFTQYDALETKDVTNNFQINKWDKANKKYLVRKLPVYLDKAIANVNRTKDIENKKRKLEKIYDTVEKILGEKPEYENFLKKLKETTEVPKDIIFIQDILDDFNNPQNVNETINEINE